MPRIPETSRAAFALGLGPLAAIAVFLIAAPRGSSADEPAWLVRGTGGMVSSDAPEASQIGAEVLRNGGNAFDAAVATSFALGVARPQSTGLGGGGFMIAYVAVDESLVVLDFRETAPAAATPERFATPNQAESDRPPRSVRGGDAIATPGLVAGLAEINHRFGTRPWAELVTPAAKLAQRGFRVDQALLDARAELLKDAARWPELPVRYPHIFNWLTAKGDAPPLGSLHQNPALARALLLLAELGPQAATDGPLADALARAAQAAGGSLTVDDLRAYRPKYREPIRFAFGKYEIVTMPPPSSGGVCLAEMLQVVDFARTSEQLRAPELRQHILVEAMKHAFADRARWLGDADFADVPVPRLTSRAYAEQLARRIQPERTLPPSDYGSGAAPGDDRGTSHFCVVDRWGNVVAITETINDNFGSLVVAEPFGILLNDEMDDFLTVPGQKNVYGLVQGEANLVAPGKRPLSSMSPTLVLKNGKPVLVLGAAGGPRIITSVAQVLLAVLDGAPLEQAMSAPRLHHQWQPDAVFFDAAPPPELREALEKRGHQISAERRTGVLNAIQIGGDGILVGASDPRRSGRPAAVKPADPSRAPK